MRLDEESADDITGCGDDGNGPEHFGQQSVTLVQLARKNPGSDHRDGV